MTNVREEEPSVASRYSMERRRQPTQKRAKATVDRILAATADLIASEGFSGVSTGAIAERAQVNISSLYQYFPNRETILTTLYEEAASDGAQKLNILATKIVYENLETAVPTMMKLLLAHYQRHAAVLLRMADEVPEIRRLTRVVPFEKMIGSTIRFYLQQHPEFRAKETTRHLFFLQNIIIGNLRSYVTEPPQEMSKGDFLAHLSRIIIAYLKGELS